MKKPENASVARSSRHYLKKRAMELAGLAARSFSEPLAAWALKRIRLEGRPFSFEGHEYLRAIYDDTRAAPARAAAAPKGALP